MNKNYLCILGKHTLKACIPNPWNSSGSLWKLHSWKGSRVFLTRCTLKQRYSLCLPVLLVSYYKYTESVDFLRFIISLLWEQKLQPHEYLAKCWLCNFPCCCYSFLRSSRLGKENLILTQFKAQSITVGKAWQQGCEKQADHNESTSHKTTLGQGIEHHQNLPQWLASSNMLYPKCIIAFWDSPTNWGSSFQILKVMETFYIQIINALHLVAGQSITF